MFNKGTEKESNRNSIWRGSGNLYKLLYKIGWGVILCWRIYVLIRYCFRYVDDDQAIMWYATVHYAHGHFPEPCFFGQNYNVMLESLLAVPLYLCGWPLYIAMPLVTFFVCILPYFVCSILLYRKGRKTGAFLTILLLALSGWQWDVLTSIPRAWISGFPWAVLGGVLINDEEDRRRRKLVGGCLCAVGCACSLSAIAIVGVSFVNLCLVYKYKIKEYIPIIIGAIPGAVVYAVQKIFYIHHSEYMIAKSDVSFVRNTVELSRIFRNIPVSVSQSFCFGKAGMFILPILLVGIVVCMIKKKRYQAVSIVILSIAGSIFEFFLGWTNVFWERSLLYGQLRMLLFWNFLALVVIMLVGEKQQEEKNSKIIIGILIGVVIAIIGKAYLFEKEISDPDSVLYEDEMVEVMPVDSLRTQAEEMVQMAHILQADVLVTTARARVFAYGASALYYGDTPVFFVPDNDRRTWIYQEMSKTKDRRLLLYSLPVCTDMEWVVYDLQGMSVTDFFDQKYGIYRGTRDFWGIHTKLE